MPLPKCENPALEQRCLESLSPTPTKPSKPPASYILPEKKRQPVNKYMEIEIETETETEIEIEIEIEIDIAIEIEIEIEKENEIENVV